MEMREFIERKERMQIRGGEGWGFTVIQAKKLFECEIAIVCDWRWRQENTSDPHGKRQEKSLILVSLARTKALETLSDVLLFL